MINKMNYKYLIKILIETYNDRRVGAIKKLTKEEMELIKKTINNKEKFIKYFRRISGIEEGDIFNAIKKKYGNKEVYFYPEQYEKDKKLLTKNVKELLKDKWDYPKQLK